MEGHCSTGQSPHWAVVPMGEEGVTAPILCNVSSRFVCRFTPRLEAPPEQPPYTGGINILRQAVYFLT